LSSEGKDEGKESELTLIQSAGAVARVARVAAAIPSKSEERERVKDQFLLFRGLKEKGVSRLT